MRRYVIACLLFSLVVTSCDALEGAAGHVTLDEPPKHDGTDPSVTLEGPHIPWQEPSGEDDVSPSDDAGEAGDPTDPPPTDPPSTDPPEDCVDPGFVSTSQGCAPDAPEPFRSRSEADICSRWQADHQAVYPEWESLDDEDPCDPGVVPAAALDNALLRTNLYRWLAGSDPVVLDDDRFETQQACAVIQDAQGYLDHHPGESSPCYTPEGAAGAGSSNLAFGAGLAGSVDLYVGDNGVPSLGHRRWLLNPTATTTQFGHKSSWSCMYSFSMDGSASPSFVAWPPPGYVPESAARGTFSFSSMTLRPTSDTVVEVAIDDGAFETVPFTNLSWGYGWGETLSFSPPGSLWQVWSAGTTVRVRIRNTAAGDVAWTTHFVSCG